MIQEKALKFSLKVNLKIKVGKDFLFLFLKIAEKINKKSSLSMKKPEAFLVFHLTPIPPLLVLHIFLSAEIAGR